MKASTSAKLEKFVRPLIVSLLPPEKVVRIYSEGRKKFLEKMGHDGAGSREVNERLKRDLWGITFSSPIMNAAGMDKDFGLYYNFFSQGAGGYICGTTTANQRPGNLKDGIRTPFVPYPRSHMASNWLGLPNEGDDVVSKRVLDAKKYSDSGFPLGVSVMGSPDLQGESKLKGITGGLKKYMVAEANFAELNESCPNTGEKPEKSELKERLWYIHDYFLVERTRNFPVIVKFSNDTKLEQVPSLLDLLFETGFDGVNFGNTSTDYERHRKCVSFGERRAYDFFTKTFGGGVSGRPLKEISLDLCARAVRHIETNGPDRKFHVIRCGGIENAWDIKASEDNGILLNQWFTGYFERFAIDGHEVYRRLYEELLEMN